MNIQNIIYNQTINQEQRIVINAVKEIQYLSCNSGPGAGKTTTAIEILLQNLHLNPLMCGSTNSTVNTFKYKLRMFVKENNLYHLFNKEIIDEKGKIKKTNFETFLSSNLMTFHSLANKQIHLHEDEKQNYSFMENHNFKMILDYIFKNNLKLKAFFETKAMSKIEIIRILNELIRLKYLLGENDVSLLIAKKIKNDVKLSNAFAHLFSLLLDLKNNLDFKYFFDLIQDAINENKKKALKNNNYFEKNNIGLIICDEYQDLESYCKFYLISIIKTNPNLRVVLFGDKNQSIYQFADSQLKTKIDLEKLFNFQEYLLLENHRSTKNVVLASREILQNSKYNQKITKKENGVVKSYLFANPYQMFSWLQRYFHDFKQNPKNLENPNFFKDFTILVRSNSDAQQVFKALKMINIPCTKMNYTRNNEIVISTIHKFKGRENTNIIVFGWDFLTLNEEEKLVLYVAETRAKEMCIILGQNYSKSSNNFFVFLTTQLNTKKIIATTLCDEILKDNPVEIWQDVVYQNKAIIQYPNIHDTKNLNTFKYGPHALKMRDEIHALYSILTTQMLDENLLFNTKEKFISLYRKENENYFINRNYVKSLFNKQIFFLKNGRTQPLHDLDQKNANFSIARNLKNYHNDLLKFENFNYYNVDPLFNPKSEEYKLDEKNFIAIINTKILSKRCCYKYCLASQKNQLKTLLENSQETTQEHKHDFLYCYLACKHKEKMKAEIGTSWTPTEQTDMNIALYHYELNNTQIKTHQMHTFFGRPLNEYLFFKELEKQTEKAYKYHEKDYFREVQVLEQHFAEQNIIRIENEKLQIEIQTLQAFIKDWRKTSEERKKAKKELQKKLKLIKPVGFLACSEAFEAHENLIKELDKHQDWLLVKRYYHFLKNNEKQVSCPSFAFFIEKELTHLIGVNESLDEKMLKFALFNFHNFFRNKPSFDKRYAETTIEQKWNDFLEKGTPFQTPTIKGYYLIFNKIKALCVLIRKVESLKMNIYQTPKTIQQEKQHQFFETKYVSQHMRDFSRGKIKRHIETAFFNAKNKILFNFSDETVITFMTLTLYNDKTQTTQITQDPKIVGHCTKIFNSFIRLFFQEFHKILYYQQKYEISRKETWLERKEKIIDKCLYLNFLQNTNKEQLFKSLKYYKKLFYPSTNTEIAKKPKFAFRKDFMKSNVIHLHGVCNFDVLKMFGAHNYYLTNFQDSEFIGCQPIAPKLQQFRKPKTIVPNLFFIWAFSWQQTCQELQITSKPLNPLSQHLAILDADKKIKTTINEKQYTNNEKYKFQYLKPIYSELKKDILDINDHKKQISLMVAYITNYMVKGQRKIKEFALSNPQWKNQQLFIYINCYPLKIEKMIIKPFYDSLYYAKQKKLNTVKVSAGNPNEWVDVKSSFGGDKHLSGDFKVLQKKFRLEKPVIHPLSKQILERIEPIYHPFLLITNLEFSQQDYGTVLEQDKIITKNIQPNTSFKKMLMKNPKGIKQTYHGLKKIGVFTGCFKSHTSMFAHLRYFFVDDLIRQLR